MRRHLGLGIVVATAGAVSIAGTLVAWASWTLPGRTVEATAEAATMPLGVMPRAAIQNGDAVVSWSAQEIVPGVPMSAYLVTAHDSDASPLPDVAHTVTASGGSTESAIFHRAELAGGRWRFAIIGRRSSWTGPEGGLSSQKLTFPAAAHTALVADAAVPEATTTPADPAAAITTPRTERIPAGDEHAPAADQPQADTPTTVPTTTVAPRVAPDPPTPSATTAATTAPPLE